MWEKIAEFVLRFRLYLLIVLGLTTAVMAFFARRAELSYDFAKVVPPDDPEMQYFQQFLKTFGEDGNLFVVGLKDSSVYRLEQFAQLSQLAKQIGQTEGVIEVLSIPTLRYIAKNDSLKKFEFKALFEPMPRTQAELDSLLAEVRTIKFYEGQIINPANGATMLVVAIEKGKVHTPVRAALVRRVMELGQNFSQQTGIDLHYAGLPYVRTVVSEMIRRELNQFLALSLLVTVVVMYLFFRSFSPVFYSLLLIGMVVVWTLGTLGILGYKITLLTALLPSILVVIGIPNCVYFITKYHQEFLHYKNKREALKAVARKIGVVTLITNTTTAIGFAVLLFVDIAILREFGIVASLNIMFTFVLSLVFIPAVFSYLPEPTPRHTRHLERRQMQHILQKLVVLTAGHRTVIYVCCLALAGVSLVGLWRIRAVSYMVDDLPQGSEIMRDLAFFEQNFKGVMPLEIVIDTGKKRVVRDLKRLRKIDAFEQYLRSLDHVSPPISVLSLLKAANQALGNVRIAETYALPTQAGELITIERYTRGQKDDKNLANSFMDSTGQHLRISLKVADMGSVRIDSLVKGHIAPKADEMFKNSGMKVHITGTTLLFIKGNEFLIANMKQSLLLAIVLIGGIIGLLFRNVRIMLITVTSNLLPILVTAGLMGFLDVSLKPSTALIFSIVFGIAVDDAIHFLAKYRQELRHHQFDVPQAVRVSILETGLSMIYTSIVLFAGFIIFAGSSFGGTIALGVLTSTTLLVAMLTNLILLPSLLLTFSKGKADTAEADDLIEDADTGLEETDNGTAPAST